MDENEFERSVEELVCPNCGDDDFTELDFCFQCNVCGNLIDENGDEV